jgi:hypothetical protein
MGAGTAAGRDDSCNFIIHIERFDTSSGLIDHGRNRHIPAFLHHRIGFNNQFVKVQINRGR